jgi:hypothetical protein
VQFHGGGDGAVRDVVEPIVVVQKAGVTPSCGQQRAVTERRSMNGPALSCLASTGLSQCLAPQYRRSM